MRRFLRRLFRSQADEEAEIRRVVSDVMASAHVRELLATPSPCSMHSTVLAEIVGEYGRSIAVIGKTAVWTNQSGVC
jgi:hypothetical protein